MEGEAVGRVNTRSPAAGPCLSQGFRHYLLSPFVPSFRDFVRIIHNNTHGLSKSRSIRLTNIWVGIGYSFNETDAYPTIKLLRRTLFRERSATTRYRVERSPSLRDASAKKKIAVSPACVARILSSSSRHRQDAPNLSSLPRGRVTRRPDTASFQSLRDVGELRYASALDVADDGGDVLGLCPGAC